MGKKAQAVYNKMIVGRDPDDVKISIDLLDALLNGLDKEAKNVIAKTLLVGLTDKQKKEARKRKTPKEDARKQLLIELVDFCETSTPPESAFLKAIFDARKNAGKDAEDDAKLLATFLHAQLQLLRTVHNPMVDIEGSTEKETAFRAITRKDMKAYVDQTMAHIGIAPKHKVLVYRTINQLMHADDKKINDERTDASRARANIDLSDIQTFNELKTTLVSAEPNDEIIHKSLISLAKTGDIDSQVLNLNKIVLELHDEPFMKGNGFARAKLYNQLVAILMDLDEKAIDQEIAEAKAKLGTGWTQNVFARLSIWTGYRKYWRSKEWATSYLSSITRLKVQIDNAVKTDEYKHLAGAAHEISNGLASARVVRNRNKHLSTLRPTLLALGSMTTLGFGVAALLGFATVGFFGFAIFSNPIILPSIIVAIAAFSTVRALYHLAHKPKQVLAQEINIEQDSKIYHDFDTNPTAMEEAAFRMKDPRTWALGSWFKRQGKTLLNSLPVICATFAVGLVINFFFPGVIELITAISIKAQLTTIGAMVIFTVMGMVGKAINKWGYVNESKPAIVIGDIMMKIGVTMGLLFGLVQAIPMINMLGNAIASCINGPVHAMWGWAGAGSHVSYVNFSVMKDIPYAAAMKGFAVSMTAAVATMACVCCSQLYTHFIDTRKAKKAETAEKLMIEPGLYSLPKPTAYQGFEKSSQAMEMGKKLYQKINGQEKAADPVDNINKYYVKM